MFVNFFYQGPTHTVDETRGRSESAPLTPPRTFVTPQLQNSPIQSTSSMATTANQQIMVNSESSARSTGASQPQVAVNATIPVTSR